MLVAASSSSVNGDVKYIPVFISLPFEIIAVFWQVQVKVPDKAPQNKMSAEWEGGSKAHIKSSVTKILIFQNSWFSIYILILS